MSNLPLVSGMIAKIRDTFKPFVMTGRDLKAEDVYLLLQNLNSAHAVAIETEDELSILLSQLAFSRHQTEVPPLGTNVIRMPIRPRLIFTSTGGGDAA
jgi:hypothetical protein